MSESGAGESFIKKVDNVLDSHFDNKIGKYSTAIDGNPKSSGLKVGNLQIGDDVNNLHDFGKQWLNLMIIIYACL